jgi:putative transposase
VLWSRFFDWKESLAIVAPETFLRWHRKGFRFYWRWKSHGGRPALRKEVRQLIARMVQENITWGEERIADELSLEAWHLRFPANGAKVLAQANGR